MRERRYVTALAAEVLAAEGSSLPGDPEELRALIDAWRRYATAVIARHGGVMAESRVREVLAYFGYPVAQEHAAERALHAALALAEHLPVGETALPAGLAVRVGVASGLVVADPDWRGAWRDAGRRPRGCRILPSLVRSSSPQARGGWPAICSLIATSVGSLSGASPVRCRRGRCSAQASLGSRSEALHAAAADAAGGSRGGIDLLLRAWRQANVR